MRKSKVPMIMATISLLLVLFVFDCITVMCGREIRQEMLELSILEPCS